MLLRDKQVRLDIGGSEEKGVDNEGIEGMNLEGTVKITAAMSSRGNISNVLTIPVSLSTAATSKMHYSIHMYNSSSCLQTKPECILTVLLVLQAYA